MGSSAFSSWADGVWFSTLQRLIRAAQDFGSSLDLISYYALVGGGVVAEVAESTACAGAAGDFPAGRLWWF